MPYATSRRFHDSFGKKISKFFVYRKAKRMYNEISRSIAYFESRFLKDKMHSA